MALGHTLVFESGYVITTYIDGDRRAKFGTNVKWNKKHDMSLHAIFSHSQGRASPHLQLLHRYLPCL